MKFLFSFLAALLCLSAPAQPTVSGPSAGVFNRPAVSGGGAAFFPTNSIIGVTPVVWYEPGISGFVTNGGTSVTLPNLVSGGSVYDMTNKAANTTWPVLMATTAVNNSNVLSFDGLGKYLACIAFTNSDPFELFYFASTTNLNQGQALVDGYYAGKMLSRIDTAGGVNHRVRSGSEIDWTGITNKFALYDIVSNGGSSGIYTNNVLISGTLDGASQQGLTLGLLHGPTANLGDPQQMACLALYSGTLTATQRSNVVYSITNRLGAWNP